MIAFIGILLGVFVSVMMQTNLATILPQVSMELGGADYYSWVFSAYIIASTVTMPICAKLADSYGRKRFYIGGMLVFIFGTLLCGMARSMEQLIACRVVQGLGAGALAPSAIAITSDLFPAERRGSMLGLFAATQVVGSLLGPLWGGYITDYFGWQKVFFSMIPPCIGAAVFVAVGLDRSPLRAYESEREKIDFAGGIILGLLSIMFIQLFGIVREWNSRPVVFVILVISMLLLFLVLRKVEKNHPDPVISPDVFRVINVRVSMLGVLLLGIILYGVTVLLPLYGQAFLGRSTLLGGITLLPFTVATGLGGILSGRLSTWLSYKKTSLSGWAIAGVGFFLIAVIREPAIMFTMGLFFVAGIGVGINLPLLLLTSQNGVRKNRRAIVAGLIQIGRNLGGAIGIPLLTGFVMGKTGQLYRADTREYMIAFLVLSLMSALGALCSLFYQGSISAERREVL